jgi:hypothetical protein
VFLVVNNGYGMGAAVERASAEPVGGLHDGVEVVAVDAFTMHSKCRRCRWPVAGLCAASAVTPIFAHPVSWHERGERCWWIRLHCGECGFVREVEVSNEEAKRYYRELNRGLERIVATVARLEREQMIADTNALTAALRRDLIDPGDFCR